MVSDGPIGPERPGGQGLDPHQEESGNRAIAKLLTSDPGQAWTDFVVTYRRDADGRGAYEAWARRGLVRWVRRYGATGGYVYEVVETIGENPIANQDAKTLAELDQELAAGRDPDDPQQGFVEPERLSYPLAYERISQLFDSPNAPDLVVNAKSYCYGREPGQHGHLDAIQSRAPLVFSGAGVRRGTLDAVARQVDIAPTIARLAGLPLIDGADATGRLSSERGVGPDVYLRRQDGGVIEAVIDETATAPERVYLLLIDGLPHSELRYRLSYDGEALPNLRRLLDRGVTLEQGCIANFPSISWPAHHSVGSGCWAGHHDVVGASYYLRSKRETVAPQGQVVGTSWLLSTEVETLHEAFQRSARGAAATSEQRVLVSAAVSEPSARGADHASLERRWMSDAARVRSFSEASGGDAGTRWQEEMAGTGHVRMAAADNRTLAEARALLSDPTLPTPRFIYQSFYLVDSAGHHYGPHHEATREALDETDRRIGRLLDTIEAEGLFDSTLFVITSDHGMAIQDASLRANPARIPERDGMAVVTTEPFIYLHDLRATVTVAPDGRTAQVTVQDHDEDERGSAAPVAGATVTAIDEQDGPVATVRTNTEGIAGFGIPADLQPAEISVQVEAEGFNSRHLQLDGTNLAIDLRELLYGVRAG
jgi:hypothetical protein